jgi:methylenetetrahydrofolate reductase (NADPH)
MNQGKIPGVELPDGYYAELQKDFQLGEAGRKKILRRAARLLAVLEGLGYAGAHIGGPGLNFAEFDYILAEREALRPNWPEFAGDFAVWPRDSFFYFREDPVNGLNRTEPGGAAPAGHFPHYDFSRWFHDLAFAEGGKLCQPLARLCRRLDGGAGAVWLDRFEHLVKFLLYRCRNCGDCTLAELAFLCPQSGCAKNILNGACGGSRNGWCEVYPGRRQCLYVLVYERLKGPGLLPTMREGFVPPRDWALDGTSSWINFFLRRDHHNRRK